jgi:hypothetical protein
MEFFYTPPSRPLISPSTPMTNAPATTTAIIGKKLTNVVIDVFTTIVALFALVPAVVCAASAALIKKPTTATTATTMKEIIAPPNTSRLIPLLLFTFSITPANVTWQF